MTKPHYDTLGVPEDAKLDDIKKAYRRKAQRAHPDKGGDKNKFQALVKAYDVLSNPDRRQQYDKDGTDKVVDKRAMIISELVALFLMCIDKVENIEQNNLLEIVRKNVHNAIAQNEKTQQILLARIPKLKKVLKRIRSKNKDNVFANGIKQQLEQAPDRLKHCEDMIELQREMLKILDDYEYQIDIVKPTNATVFVTFMGHKFPP